MKICICGFKGTGNTNLAQRLGKLYSEHSFEDVSYFDLGEHSDILEGCDSVIVTASLLDGPMPGTRAAIADSKKCGKNIVGFCFTHLDEFDKQTKVGPHIKELIEFECRELASEYGYDDDNISSVKVALAPGCDAQLKDFFQRVLHYIG